jgi:hypothetical protein
VNSLFGKNLSAKIGREAVPSSAICGGSAPESSLKIQVSELNPRNLIQMDWGSSLEIYVILHKSFQEIS